MSGIGFASLYLMRRGMVAFALASLIGTTETRALADAESWDAVFMGGNKIGWMRIAVEPLTENGRKLQRVRVDYNLEFKRGNDSSSISLQYGTIETTDGQVLRLDTKTMASTQVIRVHGDVIDGKMVLKIANGDQKQELTIPWSADTFGPYGAELSLARNPLKAGEVRTVKTFIPTLNKIVSATLTATTPEPIALGGGTTRDLLRIEQDLFSLDGKKLPEMKSTLWVDPNGQILKTFTDSDGGMTTYRTTKEAALRSWQKVDLIAAQIVKLARKINDWETKRDILYKVTLADGDPSEVFPADRRQTITKPGSTPTTALLQIKTAGPDDGEPGPELVDPEYLRSNPMITSTDPRVMTLAKRAVGNATDPWAKAQAITRWVFRNMEQKNFESTFAPSDEVARTLSGDCTEHGVLTAAMCRAEGIPARVVTGLVYVPHQTGFGFHMWNEVYVNRRWVAIDSAYDETDVDATHVKLSESSLDGVSPFESFLPVSRVFGKLRIETVEVR
jgi:transglutaminase-like putative cysteine protease